MSSQDDLDRLLDAGDLLQMLESLVKKLARGDEDMFEIPWAGISLTIEQTKELLETAHLGLSRERNPRTQQAEESHSIRNSLNNSSQYTVNVANQRQTRTQGNYREPLVDNYSEEFTSEIDSVNSLEEHLSNSQILSKRVTPVPKPRTNIRDLFTEIPEYEEDEFQLPEFTNSKYQQKNKGAENSSYWGADALKDIIEDVNDFDQDPMPRRKRKTVG